MTTADNALSHPAHGHDDHDHHGHGGHHVQSLTQLFTVYFILMVLTALTIWVYYQDFGNLNVLISMGIASVKATLVALYFMHLRYDKPFNAILFCGSFFFVALFIGLTMQDYGQYLPEIDEYAASSADG